MATTLKQLRNAIGKRIQQPFFRRFGGATATATGGSTTTLVDTGRLLQADNYWRGQFVYLPATGQVREVSASTQSSKTLTWLEPVSSSVTAGTEYEIWSQFTAIEVNDAINESLRDTWPFFFEAKEGFLVIANDTGLAYDLSALAPRFLAQVQMETLASSFLGQVTAVVAQNRLKDGNRVFTAADVGKSVRIYDGTSKGDIRTISALIDANTVEVSTNFTVALTTTSKYRVVNAEDNTKGYNFETAWSTDRFTNPTVLRLAAHPFGWEGYLLRLLYEKEFDPLTSDAQTTECPREYLELAALARIYFMKTSLAPATELDNWQAMYRASAEAAQAYALQHRFRHLPSTYKDDQVAQNRRATEYPFNV